MGFSEQRLFHSRQFIISIFFRITCVCSYCICLVIQLIWEPKRKHVVGERREREKKREQAEKEKSKEICAEVSTVLMPYKQHVVYACFFFFWQCDHSQQHGLQWPLSNAFHSIRFFSVNLCNVSMVEDTANDKNSEEWKWQRPQQRR